MVLEVQTGAQSLKWPLQNNIFSEDTKKKSKCFSVLVSILWDYVSMLIPIFKAMVIILKAYFGLCQGGGGEYLCPLIFLLWLNYGDIPRPKSLCCLEFEVVGGGGVNLF